MDVMYSIQPEYVADILKGLKTVEVRKTIPKIPVPFKAYIYCTKKAELWVAINEGQDLYNGQGKVVAEFTCDEISPMYVGLVGEKGKEFFTCLDTHSEQLRKQSRLSVKQLYDYSNGKAIYGIHISDLVIYDKPKELWNFVKPGYPTEEQLDDELCSYCSRTDYGEKKGYSYPGGYVFCEGSYCPEAYDEYLEDEWTLVRAPQSWCYCEVMPNV